MAGDGKARGPHRPGDVTFVIKVTGHGKLGSVTRHTDCPTGDMEDFHVYIPPCSDKRSV